MKHQELERAVKSLAYEYMTAIDSLAYAAPEVQGYHRKRIWDAINVFFRTVGLDLGTVDTAAPGYNKPIPWTLEVEE